MTTQVTRIYQVAVFISAIIVLVPLRWHLHAWNVGTCLYMMWVALGCLNQFINAVVWADDALIRSKIWCDISTHLQVALNVAVPACSLIMNRRLYKIANVKLGTLEDKRKAMLGDLAIGLGIPILSMMVYIIPQGHRFDIYEEFGCISTAYNTIAALLLITSWPLVLGCISAVYAMLIFFTFYKRSAQLSQFIERNPSLTVSRYWRLMAMASMEFVFTIPLATYSIYTSLAYNVPSIQPWISWQNVHSDFGHINQYPSIIWRSNPRIVNVIEIRRWNYVLCAVVFFAFFGFSAEARKNYRSASFTLCSAARHVFGNGHKGKAGVSPLLISGSKTTTVRYADSGLPLSFHKNHSVNSDVSLNLMVTVPPMENRSQEGMKYMGRGDVALVPLKYHNATSTFDSQSLATPN